MRKFYYTIKYLNETTVDLILLDIHMPGFSGFDFINPTYTRDRSNSFTNIFDMTPQHSFTQLNFENHDMPPLFLDDFAMDDLRIQSDSTDAYLEPPISVKTRRAIRSPSRTVYVAQADWIGPLTREERRIRVERYFEKRKRRTFTKKVSYICRKRVADNRQRYKGRFVSKKVLAQATDD